MSSIGPQLPPHLSKRKRTPEDDEDAKPSSPAAKNVRTIGPAPPNQDEIDLDGSDSDDGYGPKAPQTASGPSMPTKNSEEIDLDGSDSDVGPALPPKAAAAAGPSLPPPPAKRPASESDPDSDSDSDDYGPALPTAATARPVMGPAMPPSVDEGPKRDEWMLAPPTETGYAERDPTRIRARKFASKTSSSSGSKGGVSSIWTETPEEKLQRLQDAVLGRAAPGKDGSSADDARAREAEERNRKIAANIESRRGESLYEQHSKRRKDKGDAPGEEEDDPSKRAFDKEKDMALGGQIGTAKRRELMNKSANFGGRFQRGNFL
ncbi:unnamed protein product [Clonostachys rosea f. rosea IK726]|uniref:DUF3752 domain-containing protein n=2 Tax=Bionectria ochroleuca TaxID=29856 RepID=A0A0B7K5I3_BIOOC|nr:unnamed protein product [Clonostachys rosea f. rosea IK726]